MATEKTITKNIQAWLKSQPNVWHFKVHGGPFQTAGIPDLIVCANSRLVGIEVKQPGKKPTPLQSSTIRQIHASGGIAAVVTSLDEVKTIIEPLL
jgi:hypothetical protein|tara:strand:- start:399 stop:683 length:285 start_codon:yes stop_codon:yes gene_type:complete